MTTAQNDLIARTHRNIAAGFVGHRVEVQVGETSHVGTIVAVVGYSLVLGPHYAPGEVPGGIDGSQPIAPPLVIALADVDLIAKVSR